MCKAFLRSDIVVTARHVENMRQASRHCCSVTSFAIGSPSRMWKPSTALTKPPGTAMGARVVSKALVVVVVMLASVGDVAGSVVAPVKCSKVSGKY